MNLGVWEDHTWGDAALWAPEQLANFNSDPANWSVEGSEPFYETQARMMAVLKELSQKHDGGTIALVSHGAAIRSLIAALTGVPSNEITKIRHCDNTAVTEMTVDNSTGTVEIAYMGDGSHLGEAGTRFVRQDWWKSNVGYDATSMRFVGLDKENDEADYRLIRPDGDWERACLRAGKNANAAVWCICMNERAGFTELDIDRDADESIGWIDYYAMFPEWRGRFLSVQLLGHAVSLYRGLGREKIRICADGETAGYFEHFGFESIGGGILEKDIKI